MYDNFLTWTGAVVWGLVLLAIMFVVALLVWCWTVNTIALCVLYIATKGRCVNKEFKSRRFPFAHYFLHAVIHPWEVVMLSGGVVKGKDYSLDFRSILPKLRVHRQGKRDQSKDGD